MQHKFKKKMVQRGKKIRTIEKGVKTTGTKEYP
jgi:hypothetical protein